MSALFTITNDFANLFNQLDEIEDEEIQQAWFDTLEGIEGEFDEKAENIAVFVKSLNAEITALKAEEQALKARRTVKEHTVEKLKAYVLDSMQATSRAKIDRPRAKLSIRNNAESVMIEDEKSLIDWAKEENDSFLKYKEPEICKAELKQLLQSGAKIPFTKLQRTQSLIIK